MNYNDYNIFNWNPNYIGYKNDSNIYNDVYIHTGTYKINEWHNVVAVTFNDDSPRIVENINHYFTGAEWNYEYNNTHKIYDNLVNNYNEILKKKNSSIHFDDDNKYFSMLDAFAFCNSGHNLSDVLDRTDYIINNNIKHILIYRGYKDTHNFKLIELLLPSDCIFYELDFEKIYKFNYSIIIYPEFNNILKHINLINLLRNKIIEKYSDKYSECKNKNVILMKTNRNKNVMQPSTQIHCEDLLLDLESFGFINLIPEEIDTFKLFIYLLFANKIIFSVGSILYTNKLFFNYDRGQLIYMQISRSPWICTDDYLLSKCSIYNIPNSHEHQQNITINKNMPEYNSLLLALCE